MKAIVLNKYGSPENVEFKEMEKPEPGDSEVLVKIRAASVNSWDLDLIKGIPFANRAMFGLLRPKNLILGCDIAGKVEKTGPGATQLKAGDEVFGDITVCGMGGFAGYICAPEDILALKPQGMSFEDAAAISHTGLLALQGLRDKGHLRQGQKVLINGAGGGSGTLAVQLARLYGAEVTVVDHNSKFDMLRSLGADHVIDYEQEDFLRNGKLYDLILDVVTYHSVFDYKRILLPGGTYVMLGGGSYNRVFQVLFMGPMITKTGRMMKGNSGKKTGLLIYKPNKKDLDTLKELYDSGKIRPVIDKVYDLSDTKEALRYFAKGLVKGKIVISVQ